MDARGIGLVLVWLGTILLVAVLQHRLRQGALGQQGLEEAPPIERWSVAIAAIGLTVVVAGIGLSLVSFF